jgi:uncharacterized protein
MKKIITISRVLFILFSFSLSSQTFEVKSVPNPRSANGGFISDPGHYLQSTEIQALNAMLVELENSTTAEFAIVILPSIGSAIPKDFAVELFNYWGIGKKGKDNGLLLLLVMDQRRWEFECGYGLEGTLPDAILKRIGENELVPNLKTKDYNTGFENVIEAVSKRIKNEPDSIADNTKLPLDSENKNLGPFASVDNSLPPVFAPIYLLLFLIGIYYLKNKDGRKFSILFSDSMVNWKLALIGLAPFVIYFLYYTYESYIYLPPLLFQAYFFLGVFITVSIFQVFYVLSKKTYKDPYEFYKAIDSKFRSSEFIIISVLFPLPLLFFIVWSLVKRRQLRLEVRICDKCKTNMVRLAEDKDDFFLKDGQKVEEKIGSIDYDVWFCEKSKDVKIYAYESLFTSYSKCPSCKFKTQFVESDTVTVSPTCTSSGSGIRRYACKNCNHKSSSTYTIPARDCSKSSSSSGSSYSSSSSSSSSSFGGGRSGGGGAGGSW